MVFYQRCAETWADSYAYLCNLLVKAPPTYSDNRTYKVRFDAIKMSKKHLGTPGSLLQGFPLPLRKPVGQCPLFRCECNAEIVERPLTSLEHKSSREELEERCPKRRSCLAKSISIDFLDGLILPRDERWVIIQYGHDRGSCGSLNVLLSIFGTLKESGYQNSCLLCLNRVVSLHHHLGESFV